MSHINHCISVFRVNFFNDNKTPAFTTCPEYKNLMESCKMILTGRKSLLQTKIAAVILSIIIAVILSAIKNGSPAEIRNSSRVMRALYIPNSKSRSMDYIKSLVEKGKPLGINMLVMDVHTFGSTAYRVNPEVIAYLKQENFYITARIVCFQDGINKMPVDESRLKQLYTLTGTAADSGFDEVQLDYIRFADDGTPYPLHKKYAFLEILLQNFRKITDAKKVKLSADLFGRIVYNRNDFIGQKVEVFAKYTDVLYPMLYPSHYTGDKQRMSMPGDTVKDGTLKGLNRVDGTSVAIQPYIQAFPYNIQYAKMKLEEYVALQIKAVEETSARGWVAWNPNGDYSSVFTALESMK